MCIYIHVTLHIRVCEKQATLLGLKYVKLKCFSNRKGKIRVYLHILDFRTYESVVCFWYLYLIFFFCAVSS